MIRVLDSTDAREQRELEQELEDPQPAQVQPHPTDCTNGWLGDDDHGRPRPCPMCRPHLVTLDDGRVVHWRTLTRRQPEDV